MEEQNLRSVGGDLINFFPFATFVVSFLLEMVGECMYICYASSCRCAFASVVIVTSVRECRCSEIFSAIVSAIRRVFNSLASCNSTFSSAITVRIDFRTIRGVGFEARGDVCGFFLLSEISTDLPPMSAFRATRRLLNDVAAVQTTKSVPRAHFIPPSAIQRTLHVRAWEGFPTSAHLFAVVRELEKRFGPVRKITTPQVSLEASRSAPGTRAEVVSPFAQNSDGTPPGYHSYAWVEFEEPLPLQDGNLPEGLEHILAGHPEIAKRPGGIGLDDLSGLLERGGRREESEWAGPNAEGDHTGLTEVRLQLGTPGFLPREFLGWLYCFLMDDFNLLSVRRPRFGRGLKSADIAAALSEFSGFAEETTIEMLGIQSRWRRKGGFVHPTPVGQPNVTAGSVDPLAGYRELESNELSSGATSTSTLDEYDQAIAQKSDIQQDYQYDNIEVSSPQPESTLQTDSTPAHLPPSQEPIPAPKTPAHPGSSAPPPNLQSKRSASKKARLLGITSETVQSKVQAGLRAEKERLKEERRRERDEATAAKAAEPKRGLLSKWLRS